MSWQALAAVSDRILGSAARKAVVICLANHANIDSELTFPSVGRIAGETELAESTVRQTLSWLRESNLIIRIAGPAQHRPATYRLNYKAFSDLQQVEVWKPDLQVVAPDLQQVEVCDARPPGGGARPPAGGPEQYLTKKGNEEPKGTAAASPPPPKGQNQNVWVEALLVLRQDLDRLVFDTWLKGCTELVALTEGEAVIAAGNEYGAVWLREHAALNVRAAFRQVLGREVEVRFVVRAASTEEAT